MSVATPAPDAVGITKGPGETIHEYTFISRDQHRLLKSGEYVYYHLDEAVAAATGNGVGASDTRSRVLGRIVRRVPVRLYPDSFLAEPDIAPSQVASLVGYDQRDNDLFEMHVVIMGYFDPQLRTFVNPWIPPTSGTPIYLADDAWLGRVISSRLPGEVGSAHIGSLLTRPENGVPIVLNVKELVSTHLAIIASTGAGKSYLASVLIEELMKPYNAAAVVIVDPHGEYTTLQEMMNSDEFASPAANGKAGQAARAGYHADVKVYLHDQVKVRLNTLTVGDLRYLLPNLTEKQHHFLGRAFDKLKQEFKSRPWTAEDLKQKVAEVAGSRDDGGDESAQTTVKALEWKIDQRLGDNGIVFDPYQHLQLRELFKPGQCTVLQLNEIDERDQQVIVATLLRRVYNARMDTDRGKVAEGDERYLPYPVFVLLEEAHHFAPHGGEAVSAGILKQVLAEGRKFGIGIGLISQRPGKLDDDVLSQCLTQCILRIVNEVDQGRVAAAVEGVGRELLDHLPALSRGQAILAGAALTTPVLCRVRKRITPHGGESKDAPAEWQAHFGGAAVSDRAREQSVLNRNKPFDIFKR